MKATLCVIVLSLLVTSCGTFKKEKSPKETYSPVVSFEQDGKKFESKVQLPKEFKDRLPLVVVVPEWWGVTPFVEGRAEELNKEGYATIIADMYGDKYIPETPEEARALASQFYQHPQKGTDLLNKYIEIAKKDPHVDGSKVFVIGFCFGGTEALNLARSGADVKGVVSFHGTLHSTVKSTGIKAKVLALNGLNDKFVTAKDRANFEKEMKALKANYKVVNYKGATHAFTNPNATEKGKKFNMPIAYNKKAADAAWKELLKFLKKK